MQEQNYEELVQSEGIFEFKRKGWTTSGPDVDQTTTKSASSSPGALESTQSFSHNYSSVLVC